MARNTLRAAVVTVSDLGSQGSREDLTGRVITKLLQEDGYIVAEKIVIPDEKEEIVRILKYLCDVKEYELVVTNGGTGVSPRDVTPDATKEIIEREVPGIGEAMRMESFKITPYAIISRATAGIRKRTLIVNLPGSPKGAEENYCIIRNSLPHAIEKIQGSTRECATTFPPHFTSSQD